MLKLNVGISKKISDANYGSRGASVNLDLELDSALVGDPDRLKERIRHLFGLAKASVDEELNGQAASETPVSQANGNKHGDGRRHDNTRRATASQVRALNAIADRRQLDLAGLVAERFGTRDPAELSIVEASGLIDELKQAGNGAGGRK